MECLVVSTVDYILVSFIAFEFVLIYIMLFNVVWKSRYSGQVGSSGQRPPGRVRSRVKSLERAGSSSGTWFLLVFRSTATEHVVWWRRESTVTAPAYSEVFANNRWDGCCTSATWTSHETDWTWSEMDSGSASRRRVDRTPRSPVQHATVGQMRHQIYSERRFLSQNIGHSKHKTTERESF